MVSNVAPQLDPVSMVAAGGPMPAPGAGLGALLSALPGGVGNVAQAQPEVFADWSKVVKAAERKATKDRSDWDKYLRLFKEGQFPSRDGSKPIGVSVNDTFDYVGMISAMLYAQSPDIEIEPRDGSDGSAFGQIAQMLGAPPVDLQKTFADTLEQFERYAAEETGTDGACNAALQDVSLRGMAWAKVSFDPDRQMSVVDALRRDEVYVDPGARYSMSQAEYVIHINVMPIAKAQAFFRQRGVEPKANWALADGDGERSQQRADDLNAKQKDQFKFYEIWLRRADKRVILYYPYQGEDWVCPEEPWPFTLNKSMMPFVPLAMNVLYEQVGDAFPEISVVEGMRETIEESYEFLRRHNMRSMAKPVLLDADVFTDDDLKKIEDGKDLALLRIQKNGKDWGELAKVLDFNSENDTTPEFIEFFQRKRDKIIGEDELQQGAQQRKLTATQAEIADEYGKLRMGRRQKIVDAWLGAILKIRCQIDRQLADPACVEKLVGQKEALLWRLYAGNAEDFEREYSVGISAGSTGERATQQRIARLKDFLNAIIARNERMMHAGQPPRWDEDKVIIELARANKLRRPERYELPQPPPGMMPPPMMPPGPMMGPPPGPPPHPQPHSHGPTPPGGNRPQGTPPPAPVPPGGLHRAQGPMHPGGPAGRPLPTVGGAAA